MKRALTKLQMKFCDEYTSEYFGVPSEILMERAALAVFDEIKKLLSEDEKLPGENITEHRNSHTNMYDERILVLCGTGNNGADGLALCRILMENGYRADYIVPEDNGRHSRLFDFQKGILEKYGVSAIGQDNAFNTELYEKYDVIVDALFGIGLNREVSENISKVLDIVNRVPSDKVFRIAVDISSGINADNGQILGNAFAAGITVTFGFPKIGQLLYPGKNHTGRLVCASIGITDKSLDAIENKEAADKTKVFIPTVKDVASLYPARPSDGNKGTFGKVLIYAGCETMSGAAVMSAKAAFKSGCGMVRIITVPENKLALQTAVPEAMLTIAERSKLTNGISKTSKSEILSAIEWCDVILAGPGIGKSVFSYNLLKFLLENGKDKKIVLDADALNIISENTDLKETVKNYGSEGMKVIMTPHIGELSRLIGIKISDIKRDFVKISAEAAEKLGVVLIAKDAVSVVTDGVNAYICDFGNNGMATAGSGDVLAGITAAFTGYFEKVMQGGENENSLAAALCGTCIHGLAGNECLSRMTPENIMAGDIIENLSEVIKKIN